MHKKLTKRRRKRKGNIFDMKYGWSYMDHGPSIYIFKKKKKRHITEQQEKEENNKRNPICVDMSHFNTFVNK